MANTQMPNMPGATVMTDTLDFVKSLWGSMGVPGLTAPTLSVEELDKKINDLKAVESWMNLNMSMLRGSIQALEVQRGTIATLKSVGASLAAAVNQGTAQGTTQGGEKSIFDNPYASAFFQHAREAEQKAAPAPTPAPAPQASTPGDAAAQMANPSIWWNMLQDQFKQAVSTAMVSESMMTDAAVKFAAAAAQPAAASQPAPAKEAAKPAPAKPAKAGKPSADK
jgi:hypothetical protein